MYLLTETAMGDSNNFEILSFEEVEDLKKERSLLSNRVEGTKRKLALETKLRDAAQSIGRLYSPPSPRNSGEYGANGTKSHRRSRSIFGRSGAAEVLDKSDSELAASQRKCENLAQELWKLERRSQQINQRLLEHTAGVLQMTHKGLKKAPKNLDAAADNLYDGHDFDDRSLYRTPEHLDNYGLNGRIETNGPAVPSRAMQDMQRRLGELSERVCNMMVQTTPEELVDLPPQPSQDSSAAVEAQLAYLENGLHSLASRRGPAMAVATDVPSPQTEGAWKEQITEVNTRVQAIVDRFGLTRSPTLPPPPSAVDGEGLEEQLSYLQTGIDGLASRVDGLLEQKSILTTQIQQQRELNSKSDAERDAHIGDLTEQLTHARKDFELSEREGKAARDELAVLMEQLEAMRHDGSSQDEAKASLVQAEGEIARLQSVVDSLHAEADTRAEEVREAGDRADEMKEARERAEQRVAQIEEARERTEQELAQLQANVQQIRNESDARVQEAVSQRAELEASIQQIRSDHEERLQEAINQRAELEASIQQIRSQPDERLQEALEQRALAEENATRLQKEMTELEGEVVRITTELTMVKAELDGAYGTRAQRAAEVAGNPEIQREIDALNTRNIELAEELAALRSQRGGGDLQQRADTLEKELRETLDDYEAMTKASIEFEKERERFEGVIDTMRDRCEHLETQLSEERINWMNLNSPTSMGRDPTSETTSTMVLKNEFKKMMRDTRNENMKILKVSVYPIKPMQKYNPNITGTGGARRTSQDRRLAASPKKGARPSDGQTHAQPRGHSLMMMTLF
jgi:chromosome segregation ATPase